MLTCARECACADVRWPRREFREIRRKICHRRRRPRNFSKFSMGIHLTHTKRPEITSSHRVHILTTYLLPNVYSSPAVHTMALCERAVARDSGHAHDVRGRRADLQRNRPALRLRPGGGVSEAALTHALMNREISRNLPHASAASSKQKWFAAPEIFRNLP